MNYLNSGIYAVVNLVNNKRYIGQASNLIERKNEHFNKPKKSNIHLQRAMAKYGKQNFEFIILEYVEPIKEKLNSAEQRYLDFYKDRWDRLYNIAPTVGTQLGIKRSDETRNKISESKKGGIHSEETRKKISEARSKKVHQIDKITGEILATFPSATEAANQLPCSQGHISKVCLGKKKSAYGYKWQFATN